MQLTALFLLLFILDCQSYPHPHHGYEHGHGYDHGYGYEHGYEDDWHHHGYANAKCFSADSYVRLASDQERIISAVRPGDQLRTIDQSKVISTDMIMMLDKHISSEALFYTLITESGHNISLTEHHLIPIKSFNHSEKYVFAKQIQTGDLLYVLKNDQIEFSKVTNVIMEVKKGYYAPLTTKGTLVINNILASCFALVKDHHLAQSAMLPFRCYYQLNRLFHLNDPLNIYNSPGLHWTIEMMYNFASYFIPQILMT